MPQNKTRFTRNLLTLACALATSATLAQDDETIEEVYVEGIRTMIRDATTDIGEYGMTWKPNSLEILFTNDINPGGEFFTVTSNEGQPLVFSQP